jgi:hypothetical protein
MPGRTGKPINFRLDPELAARVEAAAEMEGVTLAEWWRRAANDRLKIVDDTLDLLRAANAAIKAEKARK